MKMEVRKQDLFTLPNDYYFAHCISADYALGAGIAVEFEKRFHLRDELNIYGNHRYPACIVIRHVINLVTKEKYWHKPTYVSLDGALTCMRTATEKYGIKQIAMPKIGCGLDGLSWGEVVKIIHKVFDDSDVHIVVCYL